MTNEKTVREPLFHISKRDTLPYKNSRRFCGVGVEFFADYSFSEEKPRGIIRVYIQRKFRVRNENVAYLSGHGDFVMYCSRCNAGVQNEILEYRRRRSGFSGMSRVGGVCVLYRLVRS